MPKLPRLSGWTLITLCLVLYVLSLSPQNGPVLVYKLSLVTLAGVIGYWIDRSLFPYARPDRLLKTSKDLAGVAMLRRAIIVAAAMLGVTLGL